MSAPSPPAAAPSVEPQPQLSPGRKSARSLNTFANVRAQQHGTLDARELRRWRYALLHRHSQTPPPTAFSLSSLLPCSPLPFVFLGWSSTGLVLYSYRPGSAVPGSADEVSAAFFLQLWTADPPGPLQLRREVRIWQHSSGAPDDDAAPIEEAHPHIHLLESDDEEVVVVHAFAELVQPYGERGSGAAERREPWPLERHTFTCLTLPSRGPADSSGRELSFSIELRRLTESPPLIAALRRVPPPSSSPSCASYVLLIETEATFWCLHFARSAVHYDAPVTRSSLRSARCSLLQPQSDPAVFGPRSWASWERRGEDSEQAAREDERFGGLKVVMESAFDLEAFIGRLPRVGRGGRLVDYACATLSLTSACVVDPTEARASSPCPLVALLALEQRIDAGLTTTFHFALLALDLVHSQCLDSAAMRADWAVERLTDPSRALCSLCVGAQCRIAGASWTGRALHSATCSLPGCTTAKGFCGISPPSLCFIALRMRRTCALRRRRTDLRADRHRRASSCCRGSKYDTLSTWRATDRSSAWPREYCVASQLSCASRRIAAPQSCRGSPMSAWSPTSH